MAEFKRHATFPGVSEYQDEYHPPPLVRDGQTGRVVYPQPQRPIPAFGADKYAPAKQQRPSALNDARRNLSTLPLPPIVGGWPGSNGSGSDRSGGSGRSKARAFDRQEKSIQAHRSRLAEAQAR